MTDRNRQMMWTGALLAAALLGGDGRALAADVAPAATAPTSQAVATEWPQWRGPNRDGVVVGGPKLLDSWPKEGPPLVWKSEWIPGQIQGGCGSPVVADGKVFLYVNWFQPVGGGRKYKFITTESLTEAGWNPDLPEALAKKIEEARQSEKRPSGVVGGYPDWTDWEMPKDAEYDAFLAKNPAFDKYIKGFIATLDPKDAQKYGDYIKRRFCMDDKTCGGVAYPWRFLVGLSKMRDTEFETLYELGVRIFMTLGEFNYQGRLPDEQKLLFRASTVYDTVICLDAATGKTLWKKDFPLSKEWVKYLFDQHRRPGTNWGFEISSTPAIWKGKCYAQGAMGLYCLSAKDGSLLWQTKMGSPVEFTHASPAVVDGIVYTCGAAYNAETGKQLWALPGWDADQRKFFFSRTVCGTPWTSGGKNYVLGANINWCCMDLESGKVLWKLDGRVQAGIQPTVQGDEMLVETLDAKFQMCKLSPTGVQVLWSRPSGLSSWVQWQGYVYRINSQGNGPPHVECLDAKTGDVKWKTEKYINSGNGAYLTQPILADGKIFKTCGNDEYRYTGHASVDGAYLYWFEMFRVSPEGCSWLGRFKPGICPYVSPAIADGRLYLRLEQGVACYDLRTK